MDILVGQFHMNSLGGTETFTYTLVHALVRAGHNVDLYTINPGILSDKIKEEIPLIDINTIKKKYDLALVNHNNVVEQIRRIGIDTKIIQTCHGTVPPLEAPSPAADYHVSISKEVQEHLSKQGFKSDVILNGIDCNVFSPVNGISEEPRRILSLAQSDNANDLIRDVCDILGCSLKILNKNQNPKVDIARDINEADLVFGLGRSAYEALACGRPVFVWDWRHYMKNLGDGYLTEHNVLDFVTNNCSGRYNNNEYTAQEIADEIKKNYSMNQVSEMREIACSHFNIDASVDQYIKLYERNWPN